MGFGNIVSQVILFMSIMITLIVVSLVFKNYITTTNLSLEIQHNNIVNKLDTSFSIIDASYNELDKIITISLRNTGSLKLDPNYIDLFVDTNRFSRSNFEIQLLEETNLINSLHWDPGEILIIKAPYELFDNSLLRLSVQNGIVRSYVLEV
jgi:archaellum component FlaF (FlaF/FlaG flagellin family)